MNEPCLCWRSIYHLGHDGHCCFIHGDRNDGFRADEDVCHVEEGRVMAAGEPA